MRSANSIKKCDGQYLYRYGGDDMTPNTPAQLDLIAVKRASLAQTIRASGLCVSDGQRTDFGAQSMYPGRASLYALVNLGDLCRQVSGDAFTARYRQKP